MTLNSFVGFACTSARSVLGIAAVGLFFDEPASADAGTARMTVNASSAIVRPPLPQKAPPRGSTRRRSVRIVIVDLLC